MLFVHIVKICDLTISNLPFKMKEFWLLILVSFFATNSLEEAESVKLELKTFDEIFGEGWWDKGEAEDLKTPVPTSFGQNIHHQIDRQNTQIGQNEPNSTDQFGQIEPNSTDQIGQIEPNSTDQIGQIEPNSTDQNAPLTGSDHSGQIELNSTDQNAPLTESDHFVQIQPNSTDQNPPRTETDHTENAKNSKEQKKIIAKITSNEKRKIITKFHAIKDELKQIGKFPRKERNQIEDKIANHLKVSRSKIYKWKKEFGLSQKVSYEQEERKHLIEKFDQRKAELNCVGIKNSHQNEINEIVAKELGLCFKTIYAWKSELGQTKPNHKYSHSEQKELMKRYYAIKDKNPKIKEVGIAKSLNISRFTLLKWKKLFKGQQMHQNSVDGHSVEENAAANVQEIVNINSESS